MLLIESLGIQSEPLLGLLQARVYSVNLQILLLKL